MKCVEDNCTYIIPGTEKYIPRNKQFSRLYWDEYVAYEEHMLKIHGLSKKSEKKEWSKLKKFLDKNPNFHGCSGEHKPFLEKYKINLNFSWRGWGDMMASYMNSKINKRKYDYMDFYMGKYLG